MQKMRLSTYICAGLGSGFSAVMANAAGPIRYEHHHDKAVIAGHKIELLKGMSLSIDCSVAGSAAFEVVTQPTHGRLSEQSKRIFPSFRAPNPRVKCNSRRMPAIVMYYTPNSNYTGQDFAEIRIGYFNGGVIDARVDIDVKSSV